MNESDQGDLSAREPEAPIAERHQGRAKRPWLGKEAFDAVQRREGRQAAERMLRAWLEAWSGSWVRRRVIEVMLGGRS